MSRLLGLDLGARRVGVAISDGEGVPARPLVTLRRGADLPSDIAALRVLVVTHAIDGLVVGLPLHASGDEGSQAGLTREWGVALAEGLGLPVTFRDERLTSHLAETRLGSMKRGRSGGPPSRAQRDAYRARVDREAAAIILQDELDTRAGIRSSLPRPTETSETPT